MINHQISWSIDNQLCYLNPYFIVLMILKESTIKIIFAYFLALKCGLKLVDKIP